MIMKKMNREDVKRTLGNAGKVAFGFCVGATVAGVTYALKANRANMQINKLKNDVKTYSDGCEAFIADNEYLHHEIDIRDCMIMEGIDGDPEIYARRMEHFRDYKVQTTDIEQNKEDVKEYCVDAGLDAEVAYKRYLDNISNFSSDVPTISEDDELPF